MFKKLLLVFTTLTLFLSTFLFAPQAKAAWYNQTYKEWQDKVFAEGNDNEIFGERYTYAQVLWIEYSLKHLMTGDAVARCATIDPTLVNDIQNCVNDVVTQLTAQNENQHFLAKTEGYITEARPSLIGLVKESLESFNIIPEAKAQGVGFASFEPIRNIWRASRNMAYALSVIVVLALAFMIMFRVKLSPQTVISVQSAIPRVVITLILITFSYAIAGLLFDLAYVVVGLFALLITSASPQISGLDTVALFNELRGGLHMFAIWYSLGLFLVYGIGNLSPNFTLSDVTLGPFLAALGGIVALLLAIVVFVIWIRILWTLTKAFVNVIIQVIAAPFILLLGILPGSGGFGGWVRSLLANLAVFPMVGITLFLAHLFFWGIAASRVSVIGQIFISLWGSRINPYQIQQFAPPTIQFAAVPGFPLSMDIVGFVLAVGALFMAPHAADIIKGMIEGRGFALGTAFGAAMAPAAWTYGRARGLTWDSMAGREIRDQIGGYQAQRLFESMQERFPRRFKPFYDWLQKSTQRTKERAGF